jgi:glycosyltransferase involved in cell wall biosynthesis
MTEQPLVSVIMNCYNGEKYLREAIDSVYAQTYQNWEIVFWDNCSTDSSEKIARSYDEKLTYFRGEKNVKLYAARNLALDKCDGEYIAFLDCDDLWSPNKLTMQISAMLQQKAEFSYSSYVEKYEESGLEKVNKVKGRESVDFSWLVRNYNIGILTAVIKKESMLPFSDQLNYAGDMGLFLKLANKIKIISLESVLATYRVHSGALTNKIPYKEKSLECDILMDYIGTSVKQQDMPVFVQAMKRNKKIYLLWDAINAGDVDLFRMLARKPPFSNLKTKACFIVALMPKFILSYILRRAAK